MLTTGSRLDVKPAMTEKQVSMALMSSTSSLSLNENCIISSFLSIASLSLPVFYEEISENCKSSDIERKNSCSSAQYD